MECTPHAKLSIRFIINHLNNFNGIDAQHYLPPPVKTGNAD